MFRPCPFFPELCGLILLYSTEAEGKFSENPAQKSDIFFGVCVCGFLLAVVGAVEKKKLKNRKTGPRDKSSTFLTTWDEILLRGNVFSCEGKKKTISLRFFPSFFDRIPHRQPSSCPLHVFPPMACLCLLQTTKKPDQRENE